MIVCVNKLTGLVVDVNQSYDERTHDNIVVPDGTIQDDESPNKYMRNAQGQIVKRPKMELIRQFREDKRIAWQERADALVTTPEIKQFIKDLLDEVFK